MLPFITRNVRFNSRWSFQSIVLDLLKLLKTGAACFYCNNFLHFLKHSSKNEKIKTSLKKSTFTYLPNCTHKNPLSLIKSSLYKNRRKKNRKWWIKLKFSCENRSDLSANVERFRRTRTWTENSFRPVTISDKGGP